MTEGALNANMAGWSNMFELLDASKELVQKRRSHENTPMIVTAPVDRPLSVALLSPTQTSQIWPSARDIYTGFRLGKPLIKPPDSSGGLF